LRYGKLKFIEVERSPWTAADALVGLLECMAEPDRGSGAGEGARPTKAYITNFS
jgi:hypothetical protein